MVRSSRGNSLRTNVWPRKEKKVLELLIHRIAGIDQVSLRGKKLEVMAEIDQEIDTVAR